MGLTLIADVGGCAAGFCCAMTPSRDEDAGADTAEVAALYVEPGHRRSGVARMLMAAMAAGLGARGFNAATLWVRADNAPARALYEKLGWKPDGAQKSAEGVHQLRLRAFRLD